MKFLFRTLILISITSLMSCTVSDDSSSSVSGDRLFDEQGVQITLEWNTGSGSEQAKLDANLDLSIELESKEILVSDWTTSFETVELLSFYKDETYYVKPFYADGSKNVDYTIYVRGLSNTDNSFSYKGSMTTGEVGLYETGLRITKEGNDYILK
ncbi:MAG: hypothetical protein GY827_08560 [Cytophagales bacterium]|nr:hypothetical protein [Cytophagales bacterium]